MKFGQDLWIYKYPKEMQKQKINNCEKSFKGDKNYCPQMARTTENYQERLIPSLCKSPRRFKGYFHVVFTNSLSLNTKRRRRRKADEKGHSTKILT